MRHRFKDRCAPETLNLVAMIALMTVFASSVLYAGASLEPPARTAQLAVPTLAP
jgi:hypothetical protein